MADAKSMNKVESSRQMLEAPASKCGGPNAPTPISFPCQFVSDGGSDSLCEAIVFFENFPQAVVRKRYDSVILDAGHCFGGDHGIDHGFFGGLDR